jgi:endonuclease YncB( thermonuclease family)
MSMRSLFATLLVLLTLAPSVAARPFEARVIRVKDGDSLVIERVEAKRRSEVRLAAIDAPEWSQPHGQQAATALRRMVEGRTVTMEVVDRDRYNRLVARVWLGRSSVNATMVRQGHAWAFDRYITDPEIAAAQSEARRARRGLWALPPSDRLPPATWRAEHPRVDRGGPR